MKKMIALTLVLLMALGLCACKKEEAAAKPTFQAGYGRADVTPTTSVPLTGYGNSLTRMSEGFYAKMYASCVALQDENGSTVLLMSVDLAAAEKDLFNEVKLTIASETGVPAEQIMIATTHTHSSPDYHADHPNVGPAKTLLRTGLIDAAKAAVADLSPATVQIGTTETDRMNFVRHYKMADGSYAGDNYGSFTSGIVDHASEADEQVQIIRYVRAAKDKKDIVAVNWQAHPKLSSTADTIQGKASRNLLSSDFIGTCREYLEQQLDCNFIYFQGAAGNLNARSSISGETATEDCREYGKMLGDYIIAGLDNLSAASTGAVQVKKEVFIAPVDKSDVDKLDKAREIASYWASTNDFAACRNMGMEYGIHSPYHANAIVARANMEANLAMDIYAISAGGVSFITAPYEMFDTNGMYIKENTPFDMTFILGYANSHNSYIASSQAFDYGCYEADIRRYEKGAAELLADKYLSMLTELKG